MRLLDVRTEELHGQKDPCDRCFLITVCADRLNGKAQRDGKCTRQVEHVSSSNNSGVSDVAKDESLEKSSENA